MTYKTLEERAAYARAWREKNPDKAKASDNKRRAKQPPGAATERMRRWRIANPEKAKAQWKRHYEAHKPQELERQRKHRAANIEHYRKYNARWHRENRAAFPEKERARHLRLSYGLTQEQYDHLLVLQDGHCAICLRKGDEEKHGVLHVDHDHATGKIRGLLCHYHNTALGLCHDNPDELEALAAYLRKP